MIDIEANIVNEVHDALQSAVAENIIDAMPIVSSMWTREPSQFPYVVVEEVTNTVSKQYMDSERVENYANITYEVSVFTNNVSKRKQECRKILSVIDECLDDLNFRRISMDNVSQVRSGMYAQFETTVYAIVARYIATVDSDGNIYHN